MYPSSRHRALQVVGLVPDTPFATKPQLAWRLLARAQAAGVALAWLVYRDEKAIPIMDRLEEHQAADCFELKLRLGEAQLHAKLYVWPHAAGERGLLLDSSNLTLADF